MTPRQITLVLMIPRKQGGGKSIHEIILQFYKNGLGKIYFWQNPPRKFRSNFAKLLFKRHSHSKQKTERFSDTETSPFLTVLLVCIFVLYFALKSKFCTYILTFVLLIYRRKNKVIHSF